MSGRSSLGCTGEVVAEELQREEVWRAVLVTGGESCQSSCRRWGLRPGSEDSHQIWRAQSWIDLTPHPELTKKGRVQLQPLPLVLQSPVLGRATSRHGPGPVWDDGSAHVHTWSRD